MSTLEKFRDMQCLDVHHPDMYDVILLNDDFTTMDFVINVLKSVFFKSETDAYELMMAVHNQGEAVAGSYVYDIAVSKVNRATLMAREEGFPLRLKIKQV